MCECFLLLITVVCKWNNIDNFNYYFMFAYKFGHTTLNPTKLNDGSLYILSKFYELK